MKRFEIPWELPTYGIERGMKWANTVGEMVPKDLLKDAGFLPFVKSVIKHNTVKQGVPVLSDIMLQNEYLGFYDAQTY